VDNKLQPWVVGTNGYVAYWGTNDKGVKAWLSPVNQNPVPLASDVAVGANGTVWMVGTAANNYGIYRLTSNATWEPIASNARRIAVDPQGNAWVTWSDGTVSRYDPPSGQTAARWVDWSAEPKARDVAVAGNGTVYAVGTDSKVYQRVSGKWQLIPNMLLNEISASGETVFGIKPDQTIWYLR
jgi:streptogramin lyase